MRDEQGNTLTQHGGIWLLELKKFKANHIETEDQRWLKFFREGEQLNDEALPDWIITREMKQAMSTLSTFSEKDQHYYQYQARQELGSCIAYTVYRRYLERLVVLNTKPETTLRLSNLITKSSALWSLNRLYS